MSRVTSGATYQKGSWILHMLRERLGDDAFWEGIRLYYARFMNANATTSDFREAMEEVSGDDLADFFDQWLYDGGNPSLEGWWSWDPTAQALRIEITQTQTAGPVFRFPLDIGLHRDGTEVPAIHTVDVDQRFHRFVIPLPSAPDDVTLDPNVRLLFQGDFGPR